jgi:thymidylate synthase ThyX
MTITAKIIQDSIANGVRITTFELEYPRFIHSELMTHRVFSRNAASSRAIPVAKMLQHIQDHPARPIHWGSNQPGMQANEQLEGNQLAEAKALWAEAGMNAVASAAGLMRAGVHKQIANRVTEPFQTMKTIVTSTEWDNWYWLRNHTDAQPEIHELARVMFAEQFSNHSIVLKPGEWHVPYISRRMSTEVCMGYFVNDEEVTLSEAKIISASCCAQVSYRKSDDSMEKANMIFDRLINSVPCHASPIEHQATPMNPELEWEYGATHMRQDGTYWSNNFRGWIQHRALLGV